ncbi:MAG TPA: FtsX-like permease family protein [Bacteroidales bacterium]|nr:FtsX-like permease family protein [Bacteroidales bacterium]
MMKLFRKKLNPGVDYEIAFTHILTRKMQTFIASIAVAIGIAAFIFLNSLVVGFNRDSDESFFKTMPHIRIYIDDELSMPLQKNDANGRTPVIVNPKITNNSDKLINPEKIVEQLESKQYVLTAAPWLNVNLFYNNGISQLNGSSSGVNIMEANTLFDIKSTIVEGDMNELLSTPNGIILGVGIAENLNVRLNDYISIVSALGIIKVMKVVGFFKTSNSVVDETMSYINLSIAQQLMAQGPDYLTDIYVKIKNPNDAPKYISDLEELSGYNAESWQTANESAQASKKTRGVMMGSISFIILIVAAFTIYNIINMTIKQKLHDIAILKAQGFAGKSVVKIFISEALIIGILGTIGGMMLGTLLINILSKVYIGGDTGYFPIQFEPKIMFIGFLVGLIVTSIAGYIPARSAAKVDPISIFRN